MEKRVKQILVFLVFMLFLLIYFQHLTKIYKVRQLKGSFQVYEKPKFSLKTWKSGKFQNTFDAYTEQNIGFRSVFVRIINQIEFSLFKLSSANQVIIGKQNYLYELNYINDYTGVNFIGKKEANGRLLKLKIIQDQLKKKNIDLVIAFAPGKASFYPEFIPDKYFKTKGITSNYQYFSKKSKELGLNNIDFNRYLIDIKDSVSWPIYPKCGIHWSVYGMGICLDSLVKYFEKLRGIEMVDFSWTSLEISDSLRDTDNDINEGLNLLWNIPTPPGAYPNFRFGESPEKVKPAVLTIADSFWWTPFGGGISGRLFSMNDFWFYYEQAFDGKGGQFNVRDLDLKKEFEKHDIILLLATEANMSRFPFGFIEDVWRIYFPESVDERKTLFTNLISKDSSWQADLRTQANNIGISFDELKAKEIYKAATYDTTQIFSSQAVQEKIALIKNDLKWYKTEQAKAKEKGISLNEILKNDAIWMIRNGEKTNIQRYWPIKWQ